MPLQPGIVYEETRIVEHSDTTAMSSGLDLPTVLSTPRMISWMETASYKAVAPQLEDGQTTVGAAVNIRHLAATPEGARVRVRAELLEVNGRRLRFKVDAWDAVDKIGEGEHERGIIHCAKFEQRLAEKKARLGE